MIIQKQFLRGLKTSALCLSLGLIAVSPWGNAQAQDTVEVSGKNPMTLVDLNEIPSIRSIQVSPSGQYVLFAKSTVNWKEDKRDSHIWRVNIDGTGLLQMTNGDKGESAAFWSPDSNQIAFLAKRGKDKVTQVYLLNGKGGEAIRASEHPTNVGAIEWSPDGKSIYFLADDDWTDVKKKRKKNKDDMIRFDERAKRHIWRLNLASGEATAVTSGDFAVRFFNVSDDGSKIIHNRAPSTLLDDLPNSDLWVIAADGSHATAITSNNNILETGPFFSKDGSLIYYVADASPDSRDYYYNEKLFSVPASGGKPTVLTNEMGFALQTASPSSSGNDIFLKVQEGVYNKLYRYSPKSKKLTAFSKTTDNVSQWHYEKHSNTHVVGLANAANAGDLWTMVKGRAKTKLTSVFDYLADEFVLPKVEIVNWKGKDGQQVEGVLTYPHGYVKGMKYPLIVSTHGGPASADTMGRLFSAFVPSGLGYAVLKPNYRGSTGYGDAFLRDMVGSYFNQSHLDVMTGTDYLIDRGIADPDKLIKMGWSAGGHMTNKIITFTDRFKAASSGAGAVNWIGMYAQSDIRVYRTPWFGGTPWQKDAPIETYWNHSPLKDIHKVTTPTLILVGEKDPRVPPPQSTELYRALKSNGVTTEFYLAPGEPHGWRKPSHRIFKGNIEFDWFAKHALKTTYEWEKVPSPKDEDEDDKD